MQKEQYDNDDWQCIRQKKKKKEREKTTCHRGKRGGGGKRGEAGEKLGMLVVGDVHW